VSRRYDLAVKPIPWRTQLWLVGAAYALVLLVSAGLIVARYLQYVYYPDDSASGGMFAAGDLLLGIFINCLFLVPTVFLVLVTAKSEPVYSAYARFLLFLSLTAPASLALLSFPAVNQSKMILGFVLLYRLMAMPFVLIGLGISWWMARFSRPKRVISYALLVEFLTIVLAVGLLFLS
jgi:hypothetical protein